MKALDAIQRILHDAGEPLHSLEITHRIQEQQLATPTGKTPEATIAARLAEDIKKHGTESRFRRVGPGVYTLASTRT